MNRECKKCLLLEAGERKSFDSVKDYIETLDDELKVSQEKYKNRLAICKTCDYLISGMCLKCGCYIEVRAVLKNKNCPNDNQKW